MKNLIKPWPVIKAAHILTMETLLSLKLWIRVTVLPEGLTYVACIMHCTTQGGAIHIVSQAKSGGSV